MTAQADLVARERYEPLSLRPKPSRAPAQLTQTSTLQTLVSDGQSGHSLASTLRAELQIVPHPEALLRAPSPRVWLPTRIPPEDFEDRGGGGGKHRIRTLYATHNGASAPIRRIPSAVLTRILTVPGAFRGWREILALTHVCRAWRRAALGSPQLWADAVWSLSRTPSVIGGRGRGHEARVAQFLPGFLARTCETHPVRLGAVRVAHQSYVWKAVVPHLSKLSSLSVVAQTEEDVVDVLEVLRAAGMPSLEVFELVGDRIAHSPSSGALAQLAPWRDSDFPRLRELKIPCAVFGGVTAVKSIRAVHLVAWSTKSGYVDGLSRCADTLESLTLEPWRTRRRSRDTGKRSGSVHVRLPKVRRVSISGHDGHMEEVLAALTFPKEVHIDLTFWDRASGPSIIDAALPTYMVGFHAPPLVDSLQLRLGSTLHVVARCFAGDTERLCVRRFVHSSTMLHRTICAFRLPSVTALAVNLTSVAVFSGPYAMLDPVVRLVCGLWDLRRLELLGAARGNVKARILEGFLRHHGQPAAVNADALTVAWAVQLEYGVGAAVDELEQLVEVLKAHHVTSGARLARLELCVTTDLDLDKYKAYYRVRDLCPNRIWSGRVAKRFLGRLERLADEVVILGDWEEYADDIEEDDEWYRGGGSVWKEAVAKGSCWEWAPGGEVVVTRTRIDGHVCKSCQRADIDPNSSDDDEDAADGM